ncbi:MAG: Excinuclease ABC subunit C [uncultured Thermomicrobiales bacterium]|uniref:Excinuclease ABC subunit C n=1 Tax=uncultured Thermomicrobiales bacterium TaxID=1645740 RepID=A0A6J4UAQ8_9BACT|nr:MAG: Excinuclease ABC subunit C [uncultured Thermomicrobiales bacterium]
MTDAVAHAEIAVPASESVGRYDFLIERATEFVRHKGGAVHEDILVAHVFGGNSSPRLWQGLLRQVLGAGDGLTLRADGYWMLPQTDGGAEAPLLAEFVAVDVETTGLRPLRQRVTEIALIRFRDGVETERFDSLVNPEKRIPKYVRELTGITDELVAEAPRFAEVAAEVAAFLDGALLVGHNVGFDIGFLDAELKRSGHGALPNDRLDTLGLATRLIPGLRRPNLDAVATALGLNPRHVHRAGIDAALTGEVALRLAQLGRAQGHTTVDHLRRLAATAARRPKDDLGRGRAVLDRSLLADIPKAPGVYLMRDKFDHVIYVGKAKNLRDRVGSYYSQPLGYTRKMDGLLESLAGIETVVVGSELEALLLESQLIRRYQPRYNTALRSFEHYPFIRVDVSSPWPRVTLAKARKDDGARYFGPFRNKSAARKTVDVINDVIPLRTCPRSFKDARSYGSPCIQLDLGRCLGPCVGRADRDVYAGLVRETVAFLDGRDDVLYERLWKGLEDAAARLDFERAHKLRLNLQQVTQVVANHRSLREAAETQTLLAVLPSAEAGSREVLLVIGGRIWGQYRAARKGGAEGLAARLATAWGRYRASGMRPVDHDSVDDANILNRWLYRNAGHPAIVPLETDADGPDWAGLAGRALAIEDIEMVFDVKALEGEDEGAEEIVAVG